LLVAKKNDPVTWTVPSSNETVDPYGKPHWSSIFGDVEMLDVRFQFSTTSDFKDTKADWYDIVLTLILFYIAIGDEKSSICLSC
jgi:hypothetical protein